jgi:hypothetical protein
MKSYMSFIPRTLRVKSLKTLAPSDTTSGSKDSAASKRKMILQLEHLIGMETPLGFGYAILVETGPHDQYWTVALDNGALVTFSQDKIRICNSYTHGRGINDRDMKEIIKNP